MKFKKLTTISILITILISTTIGIFLWKNQPKEATAAPQLSCNIETLDSMDMTGMQTSIALDTNGYPYIAYMSNYQLKRAKWNGSSWSLYSIPNGDVGCSGCIGLSAAIDSSNIKYIAFNSCTYSQVGMAYEDYYGASGAYAIDSGENKGFLIGAAMIPTGDYTDTANKFQAVYSDYNTAQLKHARWTISYGDYSWTKTTVDDVGSYNILVGSMALDSSNYAGAAYTDEVSYALKYAKWTGSSWGSKQTVDGAGTEYSFCEDTPSIAFDSSSYARISYTPGILKYAKWTGSAWDKVIVDSVGVSGSSIALGLYNSARRCASGDCYPYISYYDITNQDLKLAIFNGSSWDKYTVDSAGNVGRFNSIARDAAGNIHMSYYDQTNNRLKYAKCSLVTNLAPTISSVTDSPDPVTVGNNIAFQVAWSDPNSGDNTKIHICKTNAISSQTCSGGNWCETASWSASSPTSCSYTPTISDVGTQNYYAFVCDDDNACSASTSGTFTVQAAITAPTVTNSSGASNITSSSARINGEVTSTGGENPTVHIFWGDNDGGTTPANWDHNEDLGVKGTGTFYKDISGLTSSTAYYYRTYATNSGGSDWADSTSSFLTGTTALPSGTLTAPSSASPGQNFTIALEGTDDSGVKRLDLYYGWSWQTYNCPGTTSCSHGWTRQESAAGTYRYFGNIWDNSGNASSWVCNGAASGTCNSDCQGLGYILGQNYSLASFCGTNQCVCYRGIPSSVQVIIQ